MASSLLRIAVVQFAPKLGEVHGNIAKARELCRGLSPRSVDLVCFPEMIFTGYMFPDAPSIVPYLEHPKTGPTASFCTELARRLECVVVAGYPECLFPSPSPSPSPSPAPPPTAPDANTVTAPIGANVALACSATHLVHTYHKTNLFPVDKPWARPGPGFTAFDLPLPLARGATSRSVRAGIAICNDLNVNLDVNSEGWLSIERGPYELAGWCQRAGVRVLVVLNAWLTPEDGGMEGVKRGDGESGEAVVGRGGEDGDEEDALEPNWEVLNYWALRLRPLWAVSDGDAVNATVTVADGDKESGSRGTREASASHSESAAQIPTSARVTDDDRQEVVVVVCNRFGHERGKTFAGSSAMFAMRPGSGRPRLVNVMGEREEGVRVWSASVR